MAAFDFYNQQESFDTIHPSLTRIGKLNMDCGLYEVTPDIYQVRGYQVRGFGLGTIDTVYPFVPARRNDDRSRRRTYTC